MSVVDDHFARGADGIAVDHLEDLLVGIIPGRFIIGEDVDMILFGQGCDAIGIFDGGCEGFFHHNGDAFRRAGFYDAEVLRDSVVGEDGIGMGMIDKVGEAAIEEAIGELISLFVTLD